MSTDCTYFASMRYQNGRDALDEFYRVALALELRALKSVPMGLKMGNSEFCATLFETKHQPIDLSKPEGACSDQWLLCLESAERAHIVTALATNPHRNQIEIREVPTPIRAPASVIPIDGDDMDHADTDHYGSEVTRGEAVLDSKETTLNVAPKVEVLCESCGLAIRNCNESLDRGNASLWCVCPRRKIEDDDEPIQEGLIKEELAAQSYLDHLISLKTNPIDRHHVE